MMIVLKFLIISIFGTINHFVYEWLGKKKFLKYFFATDESTFEHMKLVLYPSLFALVVSLFFYDKFNLIFSSALGACTSMLLIPVLFYLIKFILKRSVGIINVLIFYVSVLIGTIFDNYIYYNCKLNLNWLGVLIYLILVGLFSYFSIYKNDCFLFDDPKK